MKTMIRIVSLSYALISSGIIYCQATKQKHVLDSKIHFGNFLPDSVYNVKTNEVLSADSVYINPSKGDVAGKVVSFDVYLLSGNMGITEVGYGNRLSKKQKILISKVKSGQLVYLQKIMVKIPGKEKTRLNSRFIFKVKN